MCRVCAELSEFCECIGALFKIPPLRTSKNLWTSQKHVFSNQDPINAPITLTTYLDAAKQVTRGTLKQNHDFMRRAFGLVDHSTKCSPHPIMINFRVPRVTCFAPLEHIVLVKEIRHTDTLSLSRSLILALSLARSLSRCLSLALSFLLLFSLSLSLARSLSLSVTHTHTHTHIHDATRCCERGKDP